MSVFWPAWVWLRWPTWRAIFLSANPRVALRDSVYCREIIESEWYRDTFAPAWTLAADQNAKGLFKNTAGGFRQALGFFSRVTGDRADALVWDDPHDAEEVHSSLMRQAVLDKWDGALGNRVNDLRVSLRVGIMQRLHEDDLAGHVLRKGGWGHLCLPMEFEPIRSCPCPDCQRGETAIGWRDPRTNPGELLFPQRFPAAVLATERARLGSSGYAGQMQQRPSAAEGEIFKACWWRFWCLSGQHLPPVRLRQPDGSHIECPVEPLPGVFDEQLQSWDMAFKDTQSSAYVTGGVWARDGARKFLLDQVRDKMSFTATRQAVLRLSAAWPEARRKLVEDKANGPAIIDTLKSQVAGLVAVQPDGSKEARAHAVTPDIEAGNVYLPHPQIAPWVNDYLAEFTAFPNGAYADQVDQTTQALRRLAGRRKGTFH